jgi:hypothetical protein
MHCVVLYRVLPGVAQADVLTFKDGKVVKFPSAGTPLYKGGSLARSSSLARATAEVRNVWVR